MPKLPKFEDWTPPWGEDDDDIDARKIAKFLHGLLSDKEKAATRLAETVSAKKELETELDEAKAELNKADAKGNEQVVGDLQTKVAKLEGELKDAKRKLLVQTVADEKGIPLKQANRLQGETQEEIEADADEFLEAFGTKKEKPAEDDEDDEDDEDLARQTPQPLRTPASDRNSGPTGSGTINLDAIPRI